MSDGWMVNWYAMTVTLGVSGVELGRFVVIAIIRRSPSPRKFKQGLINR